MDEVLWRRMQHFHFSDSHAHKDLKGRGHEFVLQYLPYISIRLLTAIEP